MPEEALVGPLGERDLGDELWLHPVNAPGTGAARRIRERRSRSFEGLQPRREVLERLRVEARPDPSGEAELATLVDAEQQRSEPRPRAARFGEPADHELLPPDALDLEPVAAASRAVGSRDPLADDSFGAKTQCVREELRTAADHVRAEANLRSHLRETEQRLEDLLPFDERPGTEVAPIVLEDVERVVDER